MMNSTEASKVEHAAVCPERAVLSDKSSFAPQSIILKKMENKMGVKTQPCLTPLGIKKLPENEPLCFM